MCRQYDDECIVIYDKESRGFSPALHSTGSVDNIAATGSATAPQLVDRSAPPIQMQSKWYDVTDWHTDPDDDTNVKAHHCGFAEGMKYAQHISTGPAGKKVKLVVFPPTAVISMLPCPLGK